MSEKGPKREGSGMDQAFEEVRRKRKEAKPLNFAPEDIEKLNDMMDLAIEVYERYKADRQIEDGQEALRLLEKYKEEFVGIRELRNINRDKDGNIDETIAFEDGNLDVGLWMDGKYLVAIRDNDVSNPAMVEGANFLLFPKDEEIGSELVLSIRRMQKDGLTKVEIFRQLKESLAEDEEEDHEEEDDMGPSVMS